MHQQEWANDSCCDYLESFGNPRITRIGDRLAELSDGLFAIVDGNSEKVVLDPDEAANQYYERLSITQNKRFELALGSAREPAATLDGTKVEVVAIIGSVEDAEIAFKYGAEGVGLLRTEFLFLDRENAPDEDEQFEIYRRILRVLGDLLVVLRTLDIGGDKIAPYLSIEPELNPFLGVRGTRLMLAHSNFFQTQLRALLRSGIGHTLIIMFPMICSLQEIVKVKENVIAVQTYLERRGIPFIRIAEYGIMVEISSAAVLADKTAQEVGFFSIGTNDLSQYTLAADRTNPFVASMADALDHSVLRLIRMVVDAAHRHHRWVGVFGELAGNIFVTPVLIGLGIDELSANPRAVPMVKQAVRCFSSEETRQIAERALQMPALEEARAYLARFHY